MIFDGHGDIWTDVTCRRIDFGETDVFRKRQLKKFRKGNVTGGIFVVWVDPPYDKAPKQRSEQIIKCMQEEFKDAEDILNQVRNFEDFEKGICEQKINVVVGLEGLSQIGKDISQIDYLYEEVGVRHAMLVWNEQNSLATGWCIDQVSGLSDTGVDTIRRMEDLGVVMDVSHLNDKCFWDAMNHMNGPVIASHSNVRSLCPVMRNLSDDMIKEIARTNGLVGVNSLREFIDDRAEYQNVERLADHVEYIADMVGIEHVGLGYDFGDYLNTDALGSFSNNLNSPSGDGVGDESEAENLLHVLRNRGYKQEQIEMIAYKNFYRVFQQVWK